MIWIVLILLCTFYILYLIFTINSASTGALIHLVQYHDILKYYLMQNNFFPLLKSLLNSANGKLMYRSLVIVYIMINVLKIEEIKSFNVISAPFFDDILKLDSCRQHLSDLLQNSDSETTGSTEIDGINDYLSKIITKAVSFKLLEPRK